MRYLIVDGHSMVFAWADLAAMHRSNSASARNLLVSRLAAFQEATGERVVVVFDGRGARVNSQLDDTGIQVVYSKSGQTADSVIERLAANYGKQHELRVATNDRAEQLTVSGFGALCLSAEQLAEEIAQAMNELSKRLRAHNAKGRFHKPRLGDLLKHS